MISNIKYRVNTLAKDLSMRTKDLLDFMEKCGMQGKTSSAVITPEELAYVPRQAGEYDRISKLVFDRICELGDEYKKNKK